MNVKKYLGVSYEHNGRSLNGLDCLGLVKLFLADEGIEFDDNDGNHISKDWYTSDSHRYIKGLERQADRIEYDDIQPLDIVVFSIDGGNPTHSGVIVDDRNRFIHVLEGQQVVIEHFHRFWRKKFHSAWKVR
jgi:cell wall-associated NlpC family hydrolase